MRATGIAMGGSCAGLSLAAALDESPRLRFGLCTDAHYADTPPRGTRHYRDSTAKLAACVATMTEARVEFLVQLGDLKDQAEPPEEKGTLEYLEAIEAAFRRFEGRRYHVLGNHDMDSLSKQQFLSCVENSGGGGERAHYSFDAKGLHFVVLDANYTAAGADYDHGRFNWSDANVPRAQLDWLESDLAAASGPTIGFIHQQLDGKGAHCVKNADEVRRILRASGKVLAVFQGHQHAGGYSQVDGIHYYTLKAMVEGRSGAANAYAIVEVFDDGRLAVTGYGQAVGRDMSGA